MADQHSNEGSSAGNVSGESSDSTVKLNIKTLDSQIYTFQVDKNVSTNQLSCLKIRAGPYSQLSCLLRFICNLPSF